MGSRPYAPHTVRRQSVSGGRDRVCIGTLRLAGRRVTSNTTDVRQYTKIPPVFQENGGLTVQKQNAGHIDRRALRNSAFGEARPNALKSNETVHTHGGQQVFRLTPQQFPATFATCLLTERICNDGLSPQRSYRLGASLSPRRRSRGFGYPFLFHPGLPQHTRVTHP